MKTEYLPATIRDRIRDLMSKKAITQAELAERIGISRTTLNRFLNESIEELGHDKILRMARVFDVSTDFLLCETNEPDRKEYRTEELGLSVQAAKNLYVGKIDQQIVSLLLENRTFGEAINLIAEQTNWRKDDRISDIFKRGINRTHISQIGWRGRVNQYAILDIQNTFMKAVKDIWMEAEFLWFLHSAPGSKP